MASPQRIVDLAGDEGVPAWQTVIDLHRAGATEALTLVGGLMAYAYSRAAGSTSPRPTDDTDFLADVVTPTANLAGVQAAVRDLGFEPDEFLRTAYRFRHTDGRVVDIMVADHLPSGVRARARLSGRDAFQVPGGQQAIDRRELWQLDFADDVSCLVGVPNVLGALVVKAAAWGVDRRDRERHLQDAASLLVAAGDVSRLDYAGFSKNDRKRLRVLRDQLQDPAHIAWLLLEGEERIRGQQHLELIAAAGDL